MHTLPKFLRYKRVELGEIVPLENLVDHNRYSLGEFARTIHRCFFTRIQSSKGKKFIMFIRADKLTKHSDTFMSFY